MSMRAKFAALNFHVNLRGTGWTHMSPAYQGVYSTNCPDKESQRLPLFLDYRTPVTVLTVRGYESLSFPGLKPPDVAAIFTRASSV
jgi:hypothetical protein